jgi:16S rRNA (cytosine1402-N4)-methyltransferase
MTADLPHVPVLAAECLEALRPRPGAWIVDTTFGAGGHARALLDAGATVVAIDRDPAARARADAIGSPRLRFAQGDFRDLETILATLDAPPVDGVLMDLGVSSMQLDEAERGFAFRQDGPLDMRMSTHGRSAADVVAETDEADLAALIYRYGEERHSRRIARAIVAAREEAPIATTGRLAEVVRAAYPGGPRRDHPARRTFQALRIYVNDELGPLEEGLEAAARVLAPGGRLAVIAYHSLEDRIVKHFLKGSRRLSPLSKKPILPGEDEIRANPRARAAKLRVAERIAGSAPLDPETTP